MNMSKKSLEEKLGNDGVNKLFDLHHWAQEKGYVSSYRGSDGSKQARNVIADILIDNPNISSYSKMFNGVATVSGAEVVVNYTSETEELVDKMIATKSSSSNVVKGELIVE